MGDWTSWADLSPLRGPAGSLDTLLRATARRLTGRRFTVPGTGGDLSLRLEELRLRPDPTGMAFGQLDDIRVVATDLTWRGVDCRRVVLLCRNVHVRPLPAPTAVAAPVTLTVTLAPEVVRDRLAAARPEMLLRIGGGEARLHWARRPGWGSLALHGEVGGDTDGETLLLRPAAVRVGGRRIPLPSWVPVARIALPALPRGLRLQSIAVGDDVVLHLVADEWRAPMLDILNERCVLFQS